MAEPVVQVRDLATYFYVSGGVVKAVDGLDLEVGREEIVTIVGESGSGKSVTGLSIMGLIREPGRIVRGEIRFAGLELTALEERALQEVRGRRLGMIFQNPFTALHPYFRIGQQMVETIRLCHGGERGPAERRAIEALERIGLEDAERTLRSYPFEVSAGVCQRVMLAMALLGEPELLIADEPTTNLDAVAQNQILELIRSLRDALHMSVLLITHDFGVVSAMADRVVVMYAGRPAEWGTAEEVLNEPKHPYSIGLIESVPMPGRRMDRLQQIPGEVPDVMRLPPGCSFRPRCPHAMPVCVLSSQDIAQSLNTVVSGVTATEMRSGIHLVDVVVRASAEERMSLSTIRTLQVPLPNGRTVPLSQIASVEYGQEYPLVWRRDRRPTLTVQADVAPGTLPATVVQALAPKIAELNASLPSGYHIGVGGTAEESAKAETSVIAVLPMALLLTLTVLMIQLQGFSRLFLVLSVTPLGLIGVVAALLLSGKPLGFVALLGVLALTGMIARNSVILVDQIETEKAHGRHPWDAVVEATMHRFRPILLTAAAAILGMIPIAPTVFWGPMAYAIMGGLAVATLLTLVFLPALYVAWFRIEAPHLEARRIEAPHLEARQSTGLEEAALSSP